VKLKNPVLANSVDNTAGGKFILAEKEKRITEELTQERERENSLPTESRKLFDLKKEEKSRNSKVQDIGNTDTQ
jgi:hypothetical protein